jgi:hypothetical protein
VCGLNDWSWIIGRQDYNTTRMYICRKINERSKEPVTTSAINVNINFDDKSVILMTKIRNDPHLNKATTNEIQKRFHYIWDRVLESRTPPAMTIALSNV